MLKKFPFIVFALFLSAAGSYQGYKYFKYHKESVPVAVNVSEIQKSKYAIAAPSSSQFDPQSEEKNNDTQTKTPPPEELNLEMTFYSQAPFGDWNYPWQEACEEASVLLIANVYLQKNWNREEFNREILKMVGWEKKRFGYYQHTDMRETAIILEEYFNLKTRIHENPDYFEIQEIIHKGHFIIMPFAGKKLGNPFYRNGGPVYHALVIKGYKKDQKLITSDVGTRRGENYVYRWEVVDNAFHDYSVPIESGKKLLIEVFPPEQK